MKYSILLTILLICSCGEKNDMSNTLTDKTYTYLAIGDSYTIGTSINSRNNYPNQLIDSLDIYGFANEKFDILAVNGWTTTNLINGLNNADFKSKEYDLVTLLIGVNNQFRGLPIELFENELNELITKAEGYSKDSTSNVLIVSIPDYSVTPFVIEANKEKIALDLAVYNNLVKKIANQRGVIHVDITPISKTAKDIPDLLASDNLHPSAKMYALWINEMLDEVFSILN